MYIRKHTHIYTHTHAYTYIHNRYEARKLEEERKETELAANEVLLRERMQVFFFFFNCADFFISNDEVYQRRLQMGQCKMRGGKIHTGDGNIA